jgi:hypothetical protein
MNHTQQVTSISIYCITNDSYWNTSTPQLWYCITYDSHWSKLHLYPLYCITNDLYWNTLTLQSLYCISNHWYWCAGQQEFPPDRHIEQSTTRVCYTRWCIDTSWSSWWWALAARNMQRHGINTLRKGASSWSLNRINSTSSVLHKQWFVLKQGNSTAIELHWQWFILQQVNSVSILLNQKSSFSMESYA